MDNGFLMRQRAVIQEPGQLSLDEVMVKHSEEQRRRKMAEEEERRRKERQEQSKKRIAEIKENCRIIEPEQSILKGSFAVKSTDNKSATKRKMRSHTLGSALRRKRLNAEQLELSEQTWKEQVIAKQEMIRDLGIMESTQRQDWALSQFLSDNIEDNRKMFQNIGVDDIHRKEVIDSCRQQIMSLDLNMDFRNDTTFAKESLRMEEIAAKTEAMRYLLKRYPEYEEGFTAEEKAEFHAKYDIALDVTRYFHIQKKIMTNSYYKTHYNSEISHKYREGDTLEQKNLTLLLWQAECRRSKESIDNRDETQKFIRDYIGQPTQEELDEAVILRNKWQNHMSVAEYGKNNAEIEDSPHAAYFRQIDVEGHPIYERLKHNNSYKITGIDIGMKESFTRYIANIPRMKAIQYMSPDQVKTMIEKIAAYPKDVNDLQEVQRCQQENIEGLKLYKEVIKKQLNYLKEKYGNGFLLMSPDEIVQHQNEFDNDFTNMQGMSELIIYFKKLRKYGINLFDDNDPSDAEMEAMEDYYQCCAFMEGVFRNFFIQDQMSLHTYSEYRRKIASEMVNSEAFAASNIYCADSMHLDVRWETVFDEQNLNYNDVLKKISQKNVEKVRDELEKKYSQEELRNLKWCMLTEEFANMNSMEAAEALVVKETKGIIDTKKAEWRANRLGFGSILIPGLGSDDFEFINNLYQEILEKEDIQADYGITTPEIKERFQYYMDQFADMGEKIRTYEAYADKALEMKYDLTGSVQEGEIENLLRRQLAGEMQKVADKYIEISRSYRVTEGDKIFNEFMMFRESVNMWTIPDHKKVMEDTLIPEIERQIPTEMFRTSDGQEIPAMSELIQELQNSNVRKENVTKEELFAAIQEYNQETARFRIFNRIVTTGEEDTEQEKEVMWAAVKRKRAFFQYDVFCRRVICQERRIESLQKIKNMLQ